MLEILTAVLMKIQVFWDVLPCQLVEVEALCSFEMSVTIYLLACNIAED